MRLLSRCTTRVKQTGFLDNQNRNQYTKPVLLHNVLVVLEMFSLFPCLHIVLGFHGVFPTQWLLVHDSTCLSMYFSCLACEVHVTFTGRKTSQTGNHSTLPRQYIAHNIENYRYYSFTFCETTLCLPSVCCHVCVVQFTCASHESTLTGKFTSLYI